MPIDYVKPNRLTDDEIKQRLLANAVHAIQSPHIPKTAIDDFENLPFNFVFYSRYNHDEITVDHENRYALIIGYMSVVTLWLEDMPLCYDCSLGIHTWLKQLSPTLSFRAKRIENVGCVFCGEVCEGYVP